MKSKFSDTISASKDLWGGEPQSVENLQFVSKTEEKNFQYPIKNFESKWKKQLS